MYILLLDPPPKLLSIDAAVELKGQLRPGVTGKDVIITLCGHFNNDEVLNHAVEFTGDGKCCIQGLQGNI